MNDNEQLEDHVNARFTDTLSSELETLRTELAESKAECATERELRECAENNLRTLVHMTRSKNWGLPVSGNAIEIRDALRKLSHRASKWRSDLNTLKAECERLRAEVYIPNIKLLVEESKKRETLESELAESKARIARLERRLRVAGKATD